MLTSLQNHKNERVRNGGLKLWAPEMHFINNRWIYLHTSNVGIGNLVICKEGKKPSGAFTDWGAAFGTNHDPSLFVDDDGTVYLAAACTYVRKIKKDFSGFEGERISIAPSNRKLGHEGSYIKKIKGKYVLFGTAWSTDNMRKGTYNLYYAVADKIEGPYGKRQFAGRCLGHGTPFEDKNGNWWCTAFYNSNTPAMTIEELNSTDASQNAFTINKQGLTLVPIDVQMINGSLIIKPQDPAYQSPGNEEIQKF